MSWPWDPRPRVCRMPPVLISLSGNVRYTIYDERGKERGGREGGGKGGREGGRGKGSRLSLLHLHVRI